MEGPDGTGYELLDAGVLRRLERFGALILDRPAPGADGFRLAPEAWANADLRFDAGAGWSGPASSAEPWQIRVAELNMELRPTASGGIGLYPEHIANVPWLEAAVAARIEPGGGPGDARQTLEVLNLFGHTGLASLALARAGASVVHVDGARAAVAWARRNADLSGLADRPIRWLVDDAAAFVAREARRERRYHGIVLDPPAFGRAGRAEWRLAEDLPELLSACRRIATPDAFVLLTAHSESMDRSGLGAMLRTAFRARAAGVEVVPLELVAASGARLRQGWAARLDPRSDA